MRDEHRRDRESLLQTSDLVAQVGAHFGVGAGRAGARRAAAPSGSMASARASATRCCWPPESWWRSSTRARPVPPVRATHQRAEHQRTIVDDAAGARRRRCHVPSCSRNASVTLEAVPCRDADGTSETSLPWTCTVPSSGFSKPARTRRAVVLPQPDGPAGRRTRRARWRVKDVEGPRWRRIRRTSPSRITGAPAAPCTAETRGWVLLASENHRETTFLLRFELRVRSINRHDQGRAAPTWRAARSSPPRWRCARWSDRSRRRSTRARSTPGRARRGELARNERQRRAPSPTTTRSAGSGRALARWSRSNPIPASAPLRRGSSRRAHPDPSRVDGSTNGIASTTM